MTETKTPTRGTVIHEHGHPTRLRAAVRVGDCITLHPLKATCPDYEGARAEAQERFPDVPFTVPRLGEKPS